MRNVAKVVLWAFVLAVASVGPALPDVQGNMELGVDRLGGDYNSFDLAVSDPGVCQAACQNDGNCQAWTFVKPGVQGASARCWLKNQVPQALANGCCISGTSGRTVGGGTPTTPFGGTASASMTWAGKITDMVSPGGNARPDGNADGVFNVYLRANPGMVIERIELVTADANGNACCGQVWSTANTGNWILGVAPTGYGLLNSAGHTNQLGSITATDTGLVLYAAESGYFNQGQNFRVTISFVGGASATAYAAVGGGGGGGGAAGAGIGVLAATYGGNCGVARGNVTQHLAAACNGRGVCEYRVDYTVIGDPAYGCGKDYVAEFTCNGQGNYSASAPPEAGYGAVVRLACQ